MDDAEKCLLIKINGASERLCMVLDHIFRRECGSYSELDRRLVQIGIESVEHAISEYQSKR